jgi:hypothetical protein
MKNNFGNYVVQKSLKFAKGELKFSLLSSLMKNVERIGDKKLMAKWKGIINTHLNLMNVPSN